MTKAIQVSANDLVFFQRAFSAGFVAMMAAARIALLPGFRLAGPLLYLAAAVGIAYAVFRSYRNIRSRSAARSAACAFAAMSLLLPFLSPLVFGLVVIADLKRARYLPAP